MRRFKEGSDSVNEARLDFNENEDWVEEITMKLTPAKLN